MTARSQIALAGLLLLGSVVGTSAAEPPTREQARAALDRAVTFFTEQCSKQGGYVWRYSRDLKLSEGEAETGPTTIWVQPPGTPAVGEVLLDAYAATGKPAWLESAKQSAHALVRGQLQSGGWYYSIEFDPRARREWGYRDNTAYRASRSKKNKTNITTLDDDVTPATVRFLARMDKQLDFQDQQIHDAAMFALEALLVAQYPNGGWYQNWDRYPQPSSEREFPVIRASFPQEWSRKWLNDWPGRYYTNDNVAGNMIATMLAAHDVYQDPRFLESARRTGDFLLLAQLPDPQPGWAQQYDPQMHPCWDRKFEPPAVSGLESQYVMDALLLLYRKTGDKKYLAPIPPALAYLEQSQIAPGRLARFYEMKSNRPLYFKVVNKVYELTYFSDDLPTHYGFVVDSELDRIRATHLALSRNGPEAALPEPTEAELGAQVSEVIAGLDDRGAWIDPRGMKGFRKASQEGVMQSETFNHHVKLLCRYLQATR